MTAPKPTDIEITPLTKEEIKWLRKLKKLSSEMPFPYRLGLFTQNGDLYSVYDKHEYDSYRDELSIFNTVPDVSLVQDFTLDYHDLKMPFVTWMG